MMTVTQVGCMKETSAHTRRDFRGYEAPSTAQFEKLVTVKPSPKAVHTQTQLHTTTRPAHPYLDLAKRQNTTTPASNGELLTSLNTALYIIDLINIGVDLNATCQELQASNATEGLAIAINTTQAADFVCAAGATNVTRISPSLVQVFAAALYAVELAGNFTGTTDTNVLCASIDVNILTLPIFGVNGQAVQNYVCNASNITVATTFSTTTATASLWPAPSAGTGAPFPMGNHTLPGTGTAPSTGTGVPFPLGNHTVPGNGTAPSPGTDAPAPTGGQPELGTGISASTGTGALISFGGQSEPSTGTVPATDPSTTYPIGGQPVPGVGTAPAITGPRISGWPYKGNLTAFPTASGSGYAQPSGTGSSGYPDPMGINFPSYYNPSSQRLPFSPSAPHYYPVTSSPSSAATIYGYGYGS